MGHMCTYNNLEEEYERQGGAQIPLWYDTYERIQKHNMKFKDVRKHHYDIDLCVKIPHRKWNMCAKPHKVELRKVACRYRR